MIDRNGPWLTVVGSTMIDLVAYATRVPERGETIVGERFAQGFGGKGANQAVMASLMGAHVAMVNAVGDDGYGEQTLANFARYGIDTAHVRSVPGSSGVAPIWVEADGSNRIIIIPGANRGLRPEHATDGIRAQARVDAVIGQFEIEPELAAASDWIIPNETEFSIIARATGLPDDVDDEAALARFAEHLATRLVVTLGERGAALVGSDGAVTTIPAPRVDAVDTTGAGDAFVGAFAYGLASGWDEAAAVRLGCAIAAESVVRPGTQSSFPDPERCRAIVADVR